jgi:oligoendopeptidase F
MWAAKPHYYGSAFYNYPYMFGLLFGLGLYALYQHDPQGFRARYDALLSRTGMADAAELAREFGFDIRTPAFWRGSFEVIRADIDQFEQLSVALSNPSDRSDSKQR